MNQLFEISKENLNKCRNCKHIQKWKCNSKFFFYCGKTKSNRTHNKLLKIKCKDDACYLFEKDVFIIKHRAKL